MRRTSSTSCTPRSTSPGSSSNLLPGDLSGVAAALSGALREPVTNGIERVLESPQFAEIWVRANRLAHEALVAILRDETLPAVSTADGAVTLDLREAIVNVGTEIGLPQTALDRIPEGAGQITIFQSEELKDVQNYVRVLDFLSWFLFLLTVGLYVLAVYLAGTSSSSGALDGRLVARCLRRVAVRLDGARRADRHRLLRR